jgi:hypothetical protein
MRAPLFDFNSATTHRFAASLKATPRTDRKRQRKYGPILALFTLRLGDIGVKSRAVDEMNRFIFAPHHQPRIEQVKIAEFSNLKSD